MDEPVPTHDPIPPEAPAPRRRFRRPELSEMERQHAFTHLVTVFSVSSGMVGVCLTTIGLVQVLERVGRARTFWDGLLVVDALIFLLAALLSFRSMRQRFRGDWWPIYSLLADAAFLSGMTLMVAVCAVLAWVLI